MLGSRLLPSSDARGIDVAQLPSNQQTNEDHHRHPYANGQRPRHAFALGICICRVLRAAAQHEKQGCAQAAQNGQKCKWNQYIHKGDYQVNAGMRSWVVLIATACAVALTAGLGFWQLNRAQTKIALQNRIVEKNTQDVSVNRSLLAINNEAKWVDMLHRAVRLNGQWLAERTVYLDNRPMAGRPGFFVLTPLRLAGSDAVVLVQRGWIPRDFQDRTRLAAVTTPESEVVITGRLAAAPSAIYELGKTAALEASSDSTTTATNTAGKPSSIRQNLDMQRLEASLKAANLRLLPRVVLQTDAASEGLLRNWPAPDSGVAKHYGYAFQWFGLCATVLVLYVWLVWLAPRRRAAKQARDAAARSALEPQTPPSTANAARQEPHAK